MRIADFSRSVILAEADNGMFSEQLPGDARYAAPECIIASGRIGALKPTKQGDVYSYGCIAILVRCAAHALLVHFTLLLSRYCRERCRTGGFQKKPKCFRQKVRQEEEGGIKRAQRARDLFILLWRYNPCKFSLTHASKVF